MYIFQIRKHNISYYNEYLTFLLLYLEFVVNNENYMSYMVRLKKYGNLF